MLTLSAPLWVSISKRLTMKGRCHNLLRKIFMLTWLKDTSLTFVKLPNLKSLLLTDSGVLGDVGGQKTLRSYWRNYFEKTDALIWVVDATDRLRVEDCRKELHNLLQEEVLPLTTSYASYLAANVVHRDSRGLVCSCSPTRPMWQGVWTKTRSRRYVE
jgi:hypothetical protein